MKTKIAINGFGRIGRAALRAALDNDNLEIVAINDLGDIKNLAYLFKHDSAYGIFREKISVEERILRIGEKSIEV